MNVCVHVFEESEGMFNYDFPLKKKLGPLFNVAVSLVIPLLWKKKTFKNKNNKKKICIEKRKKASKN